jgi:GNAT superfamily N-acetyltransferase
MFIKEYARQKGFKRLELNMWEFNEGALKFYENAGYSNTDKTAFIQWLK